MLFAIESKSKGLTNSNGHTFSLLYFQDIFLFLLEKILKVWDTEKISIEKGRWGKIYIIKGKSKIPISKDIDIEAIDLKTAKSYFRKK